MKVVEAKYATNKKAYFIQIHPGLFAKEWKLFHTPFLVPHRRDFNETYETIIKRCEASGMNKPISLYFPLSHKSIKKDDHVISSKSKKFFYKLGDAKLQINIQKKGGKYKIRNTSKNIIDFTMTNKKRPREEE